MAASLRELSETEFASTLAGPMRAERECPFAEAARVYTDLAIASRHGEPPRQPPELSNVYACADGRHMHLLFWYGVPNVYVVVVLEMPTGTIEGHHRLDLNEKYGLPRPIDQTWWPGP